MTHLHHNRGSSAMSVWQLLTFVWPQGTEINQLIN